MQASGRSYQLDVMKLFFALIVLVSHTDAFIGNNTKFVIPHAAGWWGVFFFFIVSGMLMVNSQAKRQPDSASPAKAASEYVTRRLKSLMNPYLSALFLNFLIFRLFLFRQGERLFLVDGVQILTQALFLSATSLDNFLLNAPAWYISAMLIVMLPLYYLLSRSREFYIYIFAPLTAIFTYAWCFNQENHYFAFWQYYGLVSGGIVLAVMGMSFGAVSWMIAEKLRQRTGKACRATVTALEILLYGLIFYVWFSPRCSAEPAYAVMLLMPVAVAISFSEASYISGLFRVPALKNLAPVSLAVYLNHISAWRIVHGLYLGRSYKFCLFAVLVFTIVHCPFYFLIMRIAHLIWEKVKLFD